MSVQELAEKSAAEVLASGAKCDEMRSRRFAYAYVYRHPAIAGSAFTPEGHAREEIPTEIARVCKNESNCTVFFENGTWLTTWSQGRAEGHDDQRIVCARSHDCGRTWSEPATIYPPGSPCEERAAYGIPFVVPATQRVYVFFFSGRDPHQPGHLNFVYSDDYAKTWSTPRQIALPDRPVNVMRGQYHGWVNHPPVMMPSGEVIFTVSVNMLLGMARRHWQLSPAEVFVVRCDNILMETDPDRLSFTLLPESQRGIRADTYRYFRNSALTRLLNVFGGLPEEMAWNFQEMTVVPLADGRWLGVGRTCLGSPGFTLSHDLGRTWTPVEQLCDRPGGKPIEHPMTMCPIARTSDGRIVLLFTNNDGTQRGAKHVWDGNGTTRNPQWIVAAREIPGENRNGGLIFGKPMILAEVNDTLSPNLKTGISMPQFFEVGGQYFVCYNVNKEHILLDEIPPDVLNQISPENV